MEDSVSPLTLEMLLHANGTSKPWPEYNAPACIRIRAWLETWELIEPKAESGAWNGKMTITQLGRAWVRLLCATPLPVMAYIDPRSKQVIEGPPLTFGA